MIEIKSCAVQDSINIVDTSFDKVVIRFDFENGKMISVKSSKKTVWINN